MGMDKIQAVENHPLGVPPLTGSSNRTGIMRSGLSEISGFQIGDAHIHRPSSSVTQPIVIPLLVSEAPQNLRGIETGLGRIRGAIQSLRSLASKAANPYLSSEKRTLLNQQSRDLVQHVFDLVLTIRLAEKQILDPGRIRLEIREENDFRKEVSTSTESKKLQQPPNPKFIFEFPSLGLPVFLLKNLDLFTPSNIITTIHILNQTIDRLADLQFEFNQARSRLQSSLRKSAHSSSEIPPMDVAIFQNRKMIRILFNHPEIVARAQANLKSKQVLELISP